MPVVWMFVAVMAALSSACSSPTEPSPTPLTLPLASSVWETISLPGPLALSNQDGALTFEFPTDGSVHYLYTASPLLELRGTLAITVRIATAGQPTFNLLDRGTCGIPVSVRPLIWANQNGNGDYDRWWSNQRHVLLAPGTTTLSVPLQPAAWSSVNGQLGNATPQVTFQFEKALLNVSRLGVTFGGGCSFGHGVSVIGGTATFALSEYVVR